MEGEYAIIDKTAYLTNIILTKSGFSKVYAVTGGAEGKNGWKVSMLSSIRQHTRQPCPCNLSNTVMIEAVVVCQNLDIHGTVNFCAGKRAAMG